MLRASALPFALLLTACSAGSGNGPGAENADRLTETPGSRLGDPAVSAAVNGPILVDPSLQQSANADVIRPPTQPDPVSIPPDTLGARPDPVDAATLSPAPAAHACPQCRAFRASLTLGALAATHDVACAGGISYASGWAERLPDTIPLYPDARPAEAAGNDANGCHLRIVSFMSSAAAGKVIDWYFTRARAAGFSADHAAEGAEHVLTVARGAAGYLVYAVARPDGGTDVELLVTG